MENEVLHYFKTTKELPVFEVLPFTRSILGDEIVDYYTFLSFPLQFIYIIFI